MRIQQELTFVEDVLCVYTNYIIIIINNNDEPMLTRAKRDTKALAMIGKQQCHYKKGAITVKSSRQFFTHKNI